MPEVAERRAPCTDGPLTHCASPPGEKSGLTVYFRERDYEEVRKPQQQILDCERIRDMRIQC